MSEISQDQQIHVVGARAHNLQNLSVSFPLGRCTVLLGVSGSGKSSLAFETLHAEGQRRYFETLSPHARLFLEQVERPDVDRIDHLPPSIAIGGKARQQYRQAQVGETTELSDLLALLAVQIGEFCCPTCQVLVQPDRIEGWVARIRQLPEGTRFQVAFPIPPSHSSGQTLAELQKDWEEAGIHRFLDMAADSLTLQQPQSWIAETASLGLIDRLVSNEAEESRLRESLEQGFQAGQERAVLLIDQTATLPENWPTSAGNYRDERQRPWSLFALSRERQCPGCQQPLPEREPRLFRRSSPAGACLDCAGQGVLRKKKAAEAEKICPTCAGSGLNAWARHFTFVTATEQKDFLTFVELQNLKLNDLHSWLSTLNSQRASIFAGRSVPAGHYPQEILRDLSERLTYLIEVGLDYLSLQRPVKTLSQGEFQRVAMTVALSSRLVQTLYVLDEPSQGLHPADCQRVIPHIQKLRDLDNTVLMVEHQLPLIQRADHVIELGPAAGKEGGQLVFQGSLSEWNGAGTPSARWFSGQEGSEDRIKRPVEKSTPQLTLEGVHCRYLKNLKVSFPLERFCLITGVSGSGKTSLLCDSLYPALQQKLLPTTSAEQAPFTNPAGRIERLTGWEKLDACLLVDDVIPGRSSRSTPITYLKAFDDIRKLFAETTDAQARGYTATRFSFNSAQGGRCTHCSGQGTIELEMHFLANMTIVCSECRGKRFNAETLSIKYRNRTIHDVLTMTVDEAFGFFRNHVTLQKRLQMLRDVGLGYLALGQSTATFSEGELQRLKLASFLSAATGKHELYLFDEPTQGLHPADVAILTSCFRRLIEQGHSVIAIDHHAQMIAAADWVVDLGPGAAEQGGTLIFAGPPEELPGCAESVTGQFYRRAFS